MPPNKPLATTKTLRIKGCKTCLTYLFGCTTNGSDTLPPWMIGHAFRPCCVARHSADHWYFQYTSNSKAWKTAVICGNWLGELDKWMVLKHRNILHLFDKFSGNTLAINTFNLTNVTVNFVSCNMTSVLQPRDSVVSFEPSRLIIAKMSYHKIFKNTKIMRTLMPKMYTTSFN